MPEILSQPAQLTAPPAALSRFTPATLIALVVFAAITPLLLLVAPALAAQLAAQLGLSAAQVGVYFFVELGAFSAATLPSYLWLGRMAAPRVAYTATAVFCAGNLATACLMPGFPALLALRALTALGGGTLMVLCMTSAATSGNHDRVYGFWVIGQLVAGAIGLFLLPHMFQLLGLRVLYLALALLGALAAPLARAFPTTLGTRSTSRDEAAPTASSARRAALAIAAVLTFYLAIGGVWTFASRAAAAAGFDASGACTVLAIASLFGIAGATLAALLGGRAARRAMLYAGYGILVGALALLAMQAGAPGFTVAILAFKFAWTFVLPFVLASVARVDPSGRLIATLNLVIGAGLAAGPLVAGLLLDSGGSQRRLFALAAAMAFASLALLLRVERRAR